MTEEKYKTIIVSSEGPVGRVVLNRPKIHNAFDSTMIRELDDAFEKIQKESAVRVVILTGKGESFCAGADINWLREIIDYSFEQNLKESLELAELLHKIYVLPKPSIAMVNGATIGGGNGFISACDIAVASKEAIFGLSEVKIGLVPAAISPYVIRRIGESKAREFFLTGRRISAGEALEIGLINDVVPPEKLEGKVKELAELLLSSGPDAVASCKKLIQDVPKMNFEDAKEYTARMIANLRISEEGQEGMKAFLEKRKPSWLEGPGQKKKEKKKERVM